MSTTNQDVVDYFDGMTNQEKVDNTMLILHGVIDTMTVSDRAAVRSELINEGVTIDAGICHRDDD